MVAAVFSYTYIAATSSNVMRIRAVSINNYEIVRGDRGNEPLGHIYPFVRNDDGALNMEVISPNHGRSFLLKKGNDFHWIIGKGNGLSYSTQTSVITSSYDSDTWGRLSLKQAIRDFDIGTEIATLGIKTNRMEYVLSLPFDVIFNGKEEKAALLQYSVECPYRIVDFAFIPKRLLNANIANWKPIRNMDADVPKHLIASDRLFCNLSLLHKNGVLHNAITPQNYTWALELVDFEASHTPSNPFGTKQYQSYIPMLMDMEIIQTYEIINYIAWCLHEECDYAAIEQIMNSYNFTLNQYHDVF